MPVYNTKRDHLNDAFLSLETQVLDNIDLTIFIIDDCSTLKETKTWLQDIEKKENVVVCYKEQNGGVAKALNFGLEKIMKYQKHF